MPRICYHMVVWPVRSFFKCSNSCLFSSHTCHYHYCYIICHYMLGHTPGYMPPPPSPYITVGGQHGRSPHASAGASSSSSSSSRTSSSGFGAHRAGIGIPGARGAGNGPPPTPELALSLEEFARMHGEPHATGLLAPPPSPAVDARHRKRLSQQLPQVRWGLYFYTISYHSISRSF